MTNKTNSISYFPLSVATGQAFCNREEEIAKLKIYIEQLRPVLLISPRRYGKTSLVLRAIEQSKLPFAQIDFFSVVDEFDIERVILHGIGKLITCMESVPKRALALASEFFEGTHKVVLNKIGVTLEVHHRQEKPAYRVLDILERLERLANKSNKKVVLFFDEFQCVGEIATTQAMESILRQVAQLTKSIAFIFSGSNRHLLNQMFDDRNRPFYKLCERITLERISVEAYTTHIQKVAKQVWNSTLSNRILESVFHYSKCHPYYVNLICSRLLMGQSPTDDTVEKIWNQYLLEERSSVASELELLSKSQKKLLTILARTGGTDAPLGRDFIHQANMAKTTIDQAVSYLEKKDYLYKDDGGHIKILDPLIKSVLSAEF